MNDDSRPSPDQLLSQLEAEERKARRGKLKIFFGSSAGVGKTYSMLSAAHELAKQGHKVIVGIVETHGRPHTQELVDGLQLLPPLTIPYRGLHLTELDLDKALEMKPHTILVDELAHTNTPGSRHPKRWNDVMELLDAGINVFTTLNVQHIESLSDLIAGTTGVWVKETVPDSIFDLADDIVLVDIDSDDLLKRLNEGNVYIAPGANKRAADNFFRKENLNALREIALRRTAERVDAERILTPESYARLPISDKILVCVGPDPSAAKLIRAAKRIASALKAPWTALYVERGDPRSTSNVENRRAMEVLERMVSRLDGKMVTLHGDVLLDEILTYARKNGITKIIVGKDEKRTITNFFKGYFVNHVIRRSKNIDVIVITEERVINPDLAAARSALSDLKPFNYLIAFLMAAVLTLPGYYMSHILTGTDQALLYLTGCVMVAEALGLGPAMFYALMAASAFNLFFGVSYRFHETDERAYLMTFIVMLVTGFAIARQSSRLKTQAIAARDKESRTRALYELTRKLSSTRGRFPVAEVVCTYLSNMLNIDVTVWMTNSEGHPAVVLGNLPEETYYKDFGALQWCYDNTKNAGHGTNTMPNAAGVYIPLTTSGGTLGVLGAYPKTKERLFTMDEIASMETLASLLASALERVRAGEIAQQAMVEKENKRLRETLLSALKAEDVVPSATLSAAVAEQASHPSLSSEELARDIAASLAHESARLKKNVLSLLDASSLEIGSLQANRVPSSIIDRVHPALERLYPQLGSRSVTTDIPADLPDVMIDISLVEQLILNILENALRFSPPGTTISIAAHRSDAEVIVSISDHGPGLPVGQESHIFEQGFSVTPDGSASSGLGLTIAAGIVRLHGGRIWAESLPEEGCKVSFTLPLA